MSADTKRTIKEAKDFFKRVKELSGDYDSIPDPGLQQKIHKVKEGASEVIKHIEERTDH
jgi:hypothetical protein